MRLPKHVKMHFGSVMGESRMKVWGGFCCDQCMYGSVSNVLERGFKGINAEGVLLVSQWETFEVCYCRVWVCVDSCNELGLSWMIALFLLWG